MFSQNIYKIWDACGTFLITVFCNSKIVGLNRSRKVFFNLIAVLMFCLMILVVITSLSILLLLLSSYCHVLMSFVLLAVCCAWRAILAMKRA